MATSASARRGWDQVMAQQGHEAQKQKRRRVVERRRGTTGPSGTSGSLDVDARRHARNTQLERYEADNYRVADEDLGDEYLNEDDEMLSSTAKRARRVRSQKPKQASRKIKNLIETFLKEGIDHETPNYFSASVGPATRTPRRICAVCGGPSFGVDRRTGAKLCSQKCKEYFQETKGMRTV